MSAQPSPREAPWRSKLQAALVIAIAVVGLTVGLATLYVDRHDAAELSAYNAAATCAAPAGALLSEGCRYKGEASVVRTNRDTILHAAVSFASLPGRTFTTAWPLHTEPDPASLSPGTTVDAELWSGKVTKLADTMTVDSPKNVASGLWELSVFFGVLGVPLLVWGVLLARSAWSGKVRVAQALAAAPAQLSPRSGYWIFSAVFLALGVPMSIYIAVNGRTVVERGFGVFTGIALLALGAWTGWLARKAS